ncbi:MAG TPA: hypothetical protein VGS79_13145 [Puia sp.]|nr:hypothetical protein [Puia sp.]
MVRRISILLLLALFAWRNPRGPHHRKAAGVASNRLPAGDPDHAASDARIVDSIRVLCLYGSIPAKGWQGKEPMHGPNSMLGRMVKLHGGHVTIEYRHDRALSFQPVHYDGLGGAGHLMPRLNQKNFNSCFRIYTEKRAWNVLGNYYNNLDSLRRVVFIIPVTATQQHKLDSLADAYTKNTPYDYAFFGMRCASASYEFLKEAGLVTEYRHHIWMNIFTTRDFRNALYKDYVRNRGQGKGWRLETSRGSASRKWEKDTESLTP